MNIVNLNVKKKIKILRRCARDMKLGISLGIIFGIYHFIRSQSLLTRIFGPQYTRSHRLVEIDITYNCNLRCPNCNRSCSQAPTRKQMTIQQ